MNTTQIEGLVLRQTEKALRLRIEGATSDVWVPKSQVTGLSTQTVSPDRQDLGYTEVHFSASVPSWLAARLPWNQITANAERPW